MCCVRPRGAAGPYGLAEGEDVFGFVMQAVERFVGMFPFSVFDAEEHELAQR